MRLLSSRTMNAIQRGALIVVEGVDRSGKSTQCKKLVETLRAKRLQAELVNFPDRTTPIGKLISEYLKNADYKLNDKAIHLLFAANRWEKHDKMKELLEAGTTLICDRYSYSGIVFSSIKEGMDYDWCKRPENGLLRPDLVFLLTAPAEQLSGRPGFGEERYENVETQRKVSDMFARISAEDDNWDVVCAKGEIDEVQAILTEKVVDKMRQVGSMPLRYLHFDDEHRLPIKLQNGSKH